MRGHTTPAVISGTSKNRGKSCFRKIYRFLRDTTYALAIASRAEKSIVQFSLVFEAMVGFAPAVRWQITSGSCYASIGSPLRFEKRVSLREQALRRSQQRFKVPL